MVISLDMIFLLKIEHPKNRHFKIGGRDKVKCSKMSSDLSEMSSQQPLFYHQSATMTEFTITDLHAVKIREKYFIVTFLKFGFL